MHRAFDGALLGHGHTSQGTSVISYEKILSEEEVQLAGGKYAVLATVIHCVDDHEKVGRKLVFILGGEFLHFGCRADTNAVFNGERVEMEQRFQDEFLFFVGWIFEINPEEQVGVAQQGRHQKHLNVPRMMTALGGKGE